MLRFFVAVFVPVVTPRNLPLKFDQNQVSIRLNIVAGVVVFIVVFVVA